MNDTVEGACLCGAVRFEVVMPSKWVAHCHCSMCRRAHGAAFVTWLSVPSDKLVLKAGETLRSYASSPGAERRFCGVCGSPLFFRAERWAGEVHVALAALKGAPDRAPTAHAFYSDRVPWFEVGDGLRKLGGVTGTEPLP